MDYKVYVSKENYTGRPITAYWAPANAGSNYRELAEASLDANGIAKVYDFEEDVWYDPKLRRKVVVAKKHTGSESAAIERGKNMPLELRQKLEEALAKAIADNEKEMIAENAVLDRAKMKFLLSELGRLIAEQGKIVEIAIYGGSALILQFDFRKASEDIDYLPIDWNDEFLLDCLAAQLAKKHGLEPGWFNDAIKVNPISDKNDESLKFYGDFPVDSPGLRVFVAKPEYLFAMKTLSMRSSLSSNDVEDLWNLWDELGIETAQQAIDLCRSFYPEKELPIRHVRILEDIESYKKNDKPYSPMIGW